MLYKILSNFAVLDENNIVTNMIVIDPDNAEEFGNCINIDEYPVCVGYSYDHEAKVFRDTQGNAVERILSETELLQLRLTEQEKLSALQDETLIELYELSAL